jgi:Flp pilus assembly pilin Flp
MSQLTGNEGAVMAEYGLLLAGIAIVVAAALPGFTQRVLALFQQGLAAFP